MAQWNLAARNSRNIIRNNQIKPCLLNLVHQYRLASKSPVLGSVDLTALRMKIRDSISRVILTDCQGINVGIMLILQMYG
uniref:Uncharacterized protein n=1 Tax=Romanomermis culicivorax TaxID=13658 RepID=A0A915I3N6_ROMCU